MPLIIPETLLQVQSVVLAADTTIASTTFATLLTISMNTSGGNLEIRFNGSTSNTTGAVQNRFRIQVDAVTVEGGSSNQGDGGLGATPGGAAMMSLFARVTGVASGSHTITIQWATSGGTARARPVAAATEEFATMEIQEVTV